MSSYTNYCSAFQASGTSVSCGPVHLCPGQSVVVSGCGHCSGDEVLWISSGSTQYVKNDDGCGGNSLCSKFVYAVGPTTSKCADYTIGQGCYSSTAPCSGTTSYQIMPTVSAYTEYFDNSFCDDNPVQGGITHPSSCTQVGESARYVQVSCDSASSDSAYVATVWSSSICAISTGTVTQTIYGSGSGDCESLDLSGLSGVSLKVNCAGTSPSATSSSSNEGAIIGGAVAGGVVLLIIIIVAVLLYLGVISCGKKPAAETNPAAADPASASALLGDTASPVHEHDSKEAEPVDSSTN